MPEPSVPEDSVLVSRCRTGDASAWEALVRRYQRLVYAIARRAGVNEEEAADIFQTVFMRLLQHMAHLAEPARLQAWIVTTAKREAWLVRARSRRTVSTAAEGPPGGADDPVDEAPGPDDTVAHWQLLARVQRAFERLDARCRELLRQLFADEEPGYGAVARRLKVPLGSIGPTRSRCLVKLRQLID